MAELNRENVQKLRDFIAALDPKHFDMRYWTAEIVDGRNVRTPTRTDLIEHKCGTVACIGGWARVVLSDSEALNDDAGGLLGLSEEDADELFYPSDAGKWEDVTTQQAVRVLDHLLATGEVDWTVTSSEAA